ncbi:MAG: hypothetical protein ACK5MY_04125 [Jhaorihella sp.]
MVLAPWAAQAACDVFAAGGGAGIVLEYDVVDADAPRDPPMLTLSSDGAVGVRAAPPAQTAIQSRLPGDAAMALLREIVRDERFSEIDSDALARATAPGKASNGSISLGMSAVADAPTTFITITSPDCTHSVAFYGLAFASAAHPEIDALQRLRRIELRLLGLVEKLRNG